MRSIDIAALIVSRRSEKRAITNLSLNKFVYFAQVESLKTRNGAPLFDDKNLRDTLSAGIKSVESKWLNALRMLQDA